MQALHVEELQKANTQLQHQLSTVTQERAREVGELSQRLEEAENHVQQLLQAAGERDSAMLKLEKKARLFYEVVEHQPAIARILEVLEELSEGKEEGESEEGEEGEGESGEGGSVDNPGMEEEEVVSTAADVHVDRLEADIGPPPRSVVDYPTPPNHHNTEQSVEPPQEAEEVAERSGDGDATGITQVRVTRGTVMSWPVMS